MKRTGVGQREERETACIRKTHYKNGDDDYSCETKETRIAMYNVNV